MTQHYTRNTVSADIAALREELLAAPLWKRAQILAAIAIKTGLPIYEIEKSLREDGGQ
jgi:hypothetical protein